MNRWTVMMDGNKEVVMLPVEFLESVALYYKAGGFSDKGVPIRVLNALDSLSAYFGGSV